jgi:hypothetical protein
MYTKGFAKFLYGTEAAKDMLRSGEGLSEKHWLQAFVSLEKESYDVKQLDPTITKSNIKAMRLFSCQLSYTNPGNLFGRTIVDGKTPATNASRAWSAAVKTYGGGYRQQARVTIADPVDSPLKQQQLGFTTVTNKTSSTYSSATSKGKSSGTQSRLPHHRKNWLSKTTTCTTFTRVNYRMRIRVDGEKESPNPAALDMMADMLSCYQQEDPTACYSGWDVGSTEPYVTNGKC